MANDKRYVVEFLREPIAMALVAKRGGDPKNDSIWDYCQEDEITEESTFKSKGLAFAYAKRNASRDMYSMPRIWEQVSGVESFEGVSWKTWETSRQWELDGTEFQEFGL